MKWKALYSDPHFSIPKGDLDLDLNYTIGIGAKLDDSKKEWASYKLFSLLVKSPQIRQAPRTLFSKQSSLYLQKR
jgi:hypothetical protein